MYNRILVHVFMWTLRSDWNKVLGYSRTEGLLPCTDMLVQVPVRTSGCHIVDNRLVRNTGVLADRAMTDWSPP